MQRRFWMSVLAVLASVAFWSVAARAVTIDFVPVGNPGNPNDNTGYGRVDYSYTIGKYEITNAQWREFLAAKASVGDPHGLFNEVMGGAYGGISRSGLGTADNPFFYTAKGGDGNWDNRPVNNVSYWDAARFCNWLHNGQGNGDTETGAYLNVGNPDTFARQAGAKYFIPTRNEWYKAAYHKNDGATGNYWDYPTGTDALPNNGNPGGDTGNTANYYDGDYTAGAPYGATPVGYFGLSQSPYQTFDQGGNVWEWNEAANGSYRGLHGGFYDGPADFLSAAGDGFGNATDESPVIGFRVASVPEPGSLFLMISIAAFGLPYTWRKIAYR
ncbi:MAG: SUMF1/EgtB/PvdO family nonheme iron enzyme [Pirellulales bacterium]|nr:SUMF1/EgtB/PvdO family nonheme iron enzyme [Pirellulales bacterium]